MLENKFFSATNALIKTNRLHKTLLDSNIFEAIGLHRTQHIILMHIVGRERLPSQKELADHLNITPAAVTGALKKLEADGYIEKRMGNDNRYNEITITEQGRRVVEESKAVFAKTDESLFEGFTNEEIKNLIYYLEKIQNNIISQKEVK